MERTNNTQPQLHVRKGDLVKVISGDSKGQQGKVLEVMPAERTAIVEKVNMVSKHTRPNAQNTQGGIVKQEAPVRISKLMVVDPSSGKPGRVGRRLEDGKLVRYVKTNK
ncbi:MAG: 50S ribosomal protein L24 [Bacteroidota bacterium]